MAAAVLCFKMHLFITMKAADILCFCIRILSRCLDFTEKGVWRHFQFSFIVKKVHCYLWFYILTPTGRQSCSLYRIA